MPKIEIIKKKVTILPDCSPKTAGYETYMSIAILVGLGLLHWIGLRTASRAQEIMSVAKGVGLFGFVIICFVYGDAVTPTQVVETTAQAVQKGSMIGALIFCVAGHFLYLRRLAHSRLFCRRRC